MSDPRKDEAKARIEELLRRYTAGKPHPYTSSKKPFSCLNPAHDDHSPSMAFDSKTNHFKCFACGASGDVFDLVALVEGLDPKSRETFQRTYELLGMAEPDKAKTFSLKVKREQVEATRAAAEEQTRAAVEQQKKAAAARAEEDRAHETLIRGSRTHLECAPCLSYIQGRGLGVETAKRLNLGFIESLPKMGAALILPSSDSSAIARAISPKVDPRFRYRNIGRKALFNESAFSHLWQRQSLKPVFITEGEIDACSIEEVGFPAVGMSSAANAGLVINALKSLKARHALQMPVILALDADQAGEKAQAELEAKLREIGVRCYSSNIWGALTVKDANEALCASREVLAEELRNESEAAQGYGEAEAEAFESDCCSSSMLTAFDAEVKASATRKPFSTGLRSLDGVLGGGLQPGLTILGGDPSTGKTSLALQVATDYVKTGGYAVYVSLETGKLELFAKQVARATFETVNRKHLDRRFLKDARSCIDGRIHETMPQDERDFIFDTAIDYAEDAGKRLYVLGGVESWTVEDIAEEVRKALHFLARRGASHPLVVVDYLQIIKATDERSDTIRALDHEVSELKHLATAENIPVLLLAAFNRSSAAQNEKDFSAFKGSSGIEYGADCALALSFVGDPKDERKKSERGVTLTVMKQRLGVGRADISLMFAAKYGAFTDCGLMM